MQEDYPQIELYINTGNQEQNEAIEQALATLDVDAVVKQTLSLAGVTQAVMLTLLITDDDTIRDLNKQFRQQDKATDVLSFPLLDSPLVHAPADQLWTISGGDGGEGESKTVSAPVFVTAPGLITNIGDIVISWPTVLRQATETDHTASYELLYLISHGVLHLVGYDDLSEAGYRAMVQMQEVVLEMVRR